MNPAGMNEADLEDVVLKWFDELGYQTLHGPDIDPDTPAAEREEFSEVVLQGRLRDALARLNPGLTSSAREDALRKLTRVDGATLVARNHAFHRMLVEGVTVEYTREDGSIGGAQARVIDFEHTENNDWLVLNQFTVIEDRHHRRPDVVVFVNGLPLALFELKNPAAEKATIDSAFKQIETYKQEIPGIFTPNELLVISDGSLARIGSLTAPRERFMPWRTIDGNEPAGGELELRVLVCGVFEQRRLLDLLRHFVVIEAEGSALVKKIAGYHQFHAVLTAIEETRRAAADAAREGADRKVGVVWHTQGSGKSLTMAFYAGRVILDPAMENPTIVVITDRNDLDDQLFSTFSRCHELLRQQPVQATSRGDLREHLTTDAGGVVFTTIHKFLDPEGAGRPLSERRNIIVIADEAHRSQYDFIQGFARSMHDALPNASYIGFTGTPIERADANTRAVFGDYIDIYDIRMSVEDGATVPILYESRLAKLALSEVQRPQLDPEFEELTEGEEAERKEKLKSKWARLEAIVGSEARLAMVAKDLVAHFEGRQEAIDGKAMVVCMSRRICMDLHDEIVKLRPEWYSENDAEGTVKVVMTGSADEGPRVAEHARNKLRREALADRMRDPEDPLKLVIVRDMWLTGFDAPSMHTMYVDKPMRGHNLMQAIARVNRVFRDKPGGLVVDYLGIADALQLAVGKYSDAGGNGEPVLDEAAAMMVMRERYEICLDIFHGFDWSAWTGDDKEARLSLLPDAQEHVLAQPEGKKRLLAAVTGLSKAFALVVPADAALAIRDDVGFFQAVRAALTKSVGDGERSEEELDHAIHDIVSRAVEPGEVIDVFAAAGLPKPNIEVLSDDFLARVRSLPQKNLAVEMLDKLLKNEIGSRGKRNVVEARKFSEMLDETIKLYQNRSIEAAKVIEELIRLAESLKAAAARGEELGLTDDELAFYDALGDNTSAAMVMGDEQLSVIAKELVEAVRRNVTIDWTVRENVRAKLRVMVKRILRKYGYPPDLQDSATETVLEQAELIAADWA